MKKVGKRSDAQDVKCLPAIIEISAEALKAAQGDEQAFVKFMKKYLKDKQEQLIVSSKRDEE